PRLDQAVLVPRRFRGARRAGRRHGRPRGVRGSRGHRPGRDLCGQSGLAVPGFVDARLPGRGRSGRAGTGGPGGDRRRALVHPYRNSAVPGGGAVRFRSADGRLDRPLPHKGLAHVVGDSANWALTWTIVGLVSAVPSGNRTVGTVWLPPLTLITN